MTTGTPLVDVVAGIAMDGGVDAKSELGAALAEETEPCSVDTALSALGDETKDWTLPPAALVTGMIGVVDMRLDAALLTPETKTDAEVDMDGDSDVQGAVDTEFIWLGLTEADETSADADVATTLEAVGEPVD